MSRQRVVGNEVVSTCNSLGFLDEDEVYQKDPDCLSSIKDILRFLNHDDRSFEVRRLIGSTNIVVNDLIPLLRDDCLQDAELMPMLLRLLQNLTSPVSLVMDKYEMTPDDDKETKKIYLELNSHLYGYKRAFGGVLKSWTTLSKRMAHILQLDWEHHHEEDEVLLQRILSVVRNLLHIPLDPSFEQETDDDLNPQDRLLEKMHLSGVSDMLLMLASAEEEKRVDRYLFVIEIVSLMFRGQSPEFLAKSVDPHTLTEASNRRTLYEKEKDGQELKDILTSDRKRLQSVRPVYSRFKESTYEVKNMKSLSDKDLIYHKTPLDLNTISLDRNKKLTRRRQNQMPMSDCNQSSWSLINGPSFHRSTQRLRKQLFAFCTDFLNSYNQLMPIIRDLLQGSRGTQDNDETYYLWAIQFFMEFNRNANPDVELVSETVTIDNIHYIHTLIQNFADMLKLEKKQKKVKIVPISRRLHYALKAYRELFLTLHFVDSGKNVLHKEMSKDIKKKVFYEIEYRELLLSLFRDFNQTKMSVQFLVDLVETNHVFLKLLEHYCKTNTRVVVKEKKRKIRKRKKSKKETQNNDFREIVWTQITDRVSEALQGSLSLPTPEENEQVIPLDSSVDMQPDNQKLAIMKRIQTLLSEEEVPAAVALYRNAREAWSDDPEMPFGPQDIPLEDELQALRDILLTPFLEETEPDDEVEDRETEAEALLSSVRESEFNYIDFVSRYCDHKVIAPYAQVLKTYAANSPVTNHCVAKMLHRIAWDCKMHALLFQASIFRVFQQILDDPLRDSSPAIKELATFATFIVRKFIEVARKNKKIFVEILFWKNKREAYEVEEGYGSFRSNKVRGKEIWAEEEEYEVERLYNEFKDTDGDKDVADHIVDNLIDKGKTRRQVLRELKRQGLVVIKRDKKGVRKERIDQFNIKSKEFIDDENSDSERSENEEEEEKNGKEEEEEKAKENKTEKEKEAEEEGDGSGSGDVADPADEKVVSRFVEPIESEAAKDMREEDEEAEQHTDISEILKKKKRNRFVSSSDESSDVDVSKLVMDEDRTEILAPNSSPIKRKAKRVRVQAFAGSSDEDEPKSDRGNC